MHLLEGGVYWKAAFIRRNTVLQNNNLSSQAYFKVINMQYIV